MTKNVALSKWPMTSVRSPLFRDPALESLKPMIKTLPALARPTGQELVQSVMADFPRQFKLPSQRLLVFFQSRHHVRNLLLGREVGQDDRQLDQRVDGNGGQGRAASGMRF